jgi:uncharacterized protein (TIGR03435 family)
MAPHLAAQDAPVDRFEVASVKPGGSSQMVGVMVYPGPRVVLSRLWLKTLVRTAYGFNFHQIVNRGDAWIEREAWSVEAKVPANSGITNLRYSLYDIEDPRLRQMLQALLVERFQLKVSRETKMGDVYHLTRTNRPLRLSLWDGKMPQGGELFASFSSIGYGGGRWVISRTSMEQLARFAGTYRVQAPVVDMTNLSGLYDYKQTVGDQEPARPASTEMMDSFLRMLKEVGLELKRTRGPVEILVIESAQRASPN